MYLFTSERLGFRAWKQEDIGELSAMNKDPDVMEFFPSTLSVADSQDLLNRLQAQYQENHFTFYAVELLQDQSFIGFIGLARTSFEEDFTPCVEIGWRLKKSAWNCGYATEGALRCLDFASHDLGIDGVYSFTPCVNFRSEKVMKKIGMKKVKEFRHPKIPPHHQLSNHVLYFVSLK
ncbi:MAG TPA: N-acetyltransferase [Saprospiraceae bacterium]|nr:N-acetyltransferase [Saprospiraceae bacterium]